MKKALSFLVKYGYALLSSAYLFTFGIFSARHRAFLNTVTIHFGYDADARADSTILPQVEINSIFQDAPPVIIRAPEGIDGNVSLSELIILNTLVKKREAKTVFEIGTFDGRTALNLAANAEKGTVYTLDLPAENQHTKFLITGDRKFFPKPVQALRWRGTPYQERISALHGDSAAFDFSPYEGAIDFIFIDGAHTYEYVKNDSEKALAILADNGIIFWHDYGSWEGVTQALNELYHTRPEFKELKHIRGTSLAFLVR